MTWQDILITIASIVFSVALIPQIYYGFKNKKGTIKHATSIPTFLGIYAISFAYFTLDLFFSMVVGVITGTLWFILFIQKLVYSKQRL